MPHRPPRQPHRPPRAPSVEAMNTLEQRYWFYQVRAGGLCLAGSGSSRYRNDRNPAPKSAGEMAATRAGWVSLSWKRRVRDVLSNGPGSDVCLICVTNAARILDLGDLGANGENANRQIAALHCRRWRSSTGPACELPRLRNQQQSLSAGFSFSGSTLTSILDGRSLEPR